jgi:hypothetical protein
VDAIVKKRPTKLFKGITVGGVALAIMAGLGLWGSSVRTFRFLDGHRVTDRVVSGRQVIQYYHFKGDFNDVYAEATAELVARGFSEHNEGRPSTYGSPSLRRREVSFYRVGGGEWERVRIVGIERYGTVRVQIIAPAPCRLRGRLRSLARRLRRIGQSAG